jgi:D-serine deaminase-like pyridoxal phosphate-dependent protein
MDTQYFSQLSAALSQAGLASPVLVIDKTLLDQNIAALKETLEKGFAYRVVAKSLPSIPLLEYLFAATNTNCLMCFHLPFLMHLAEHSWSSDIDILLGKPMPVKALKTFYQHDRRKLESQKFDAEKHVQWLVDSLQRLDEYEAFAREYGLHLRLNIEIDIGLHRGGFTHEDAFKECLRRIKNAENLELSGLMGYDAHVAKVPKVLGGISGAERAAKKRYSEFVALLDEVYGSHEALCLNAGGSPTYSLYQQGDINNELAVASALVKPSDFDISTLSQHVPAAFIATPILKTLDKPDLPMASGLSALMRKIGILPQRASFIYGGNWLADPCYPQGAARVPLFGHSSNQEMYSLPESSGLKENDYMFFRPKQSEAVFLQFGQIAVYEQGKIVDWWSVFDSSKTPRLIDEKDS